MYIVVEREAGDRIVVCGRDRRIVRTFIAVRNSAVGSQDEIGLCLSRALLGIGALESCHRGRSWACRRWRASGVPCGSSAWPGRGRGSYASTCTPSSCPRKGPRTAHPTQGKRCGSRCEVSWPLFLTFLSEEGYRRLTESTLQADPKYGKRKPCSFKEAL